MEWSAIFPYVGVKKVGDALDEPSLPWTTRSLCPECLRVIEGKIAEEDGQVYLLKACPQHGPWRELLSMDAEFYQLMHRRDRGLCRSRIHVFSEQKHSCPNGCGLCRDHQSAPILVNIDLTNRCNLRCPICFMENRKTALKKQ